MLLALCAMIAVGSTAGSPAASAHHMAAPCPAIGTYAVGATAPVPGAAQSGTGTAIAIPYPGFLYGLTGILTITGYTGCSGTTTGSFDVHSPVRPLNGPQPEQPGVRAPGSVAPIYPVVGATGVLTATGTIAQDASHPGDPTYLSITANVIYGRYSLACPPICAKGGNNARLPCPAAGCAYSTVVTRTAAFGSVTGFLRMQLGQRVLAGLAFLPPPDPTQATATAAMQVQPISFVGVRTGS
jgi:hypothetical protein